MIRINLEKTKPDTKQTQILVLGLFEGEPESLLKRLENSVLSLMKEILENAWAR